MSDGSASLSVDIALWVMAQVQTPASIQYFLLEFRHRRKKYLLYSVVPFSDCISFLYYSVYKSFALDIDQRDEQNTIHITLKGKGYFCYRNIKKEVTNLKNPLVFKLFSLITVCAQTILK